MTTHDTYATTTSQSKARTLRERAAEEPQGQDDHGLDDGDLNVGLRHVGVALGWRGRRLLDHSATLSVASRRSAAVSAAVALVHQASSASSCWRDAFAARAVSSGAGPPCVRLTSTKWRGLRMRAKASSE